MQIMDGKDMGNPADPEKPEQEMPKPTSSGTEQDDFEAAAQSTVDLDSFMPQLKPKRTGRRIAWVVAILVVLVAVGGGAYLALKHKSSKTPPQSSHQSTTNNQATITTTTKQYTSSNFNLSFNYPQDWSVSDTGGGKLTVTSPTMQLKDANGQSESGQVVMTIQNENAMDFSMFKQGSAVAVLDSQKIAYSSPTPTQRANTYLSFLQYATTTAQGALDGVYITGDFGYMKNGYIPETDIQKVDPDIAVTFSQCSNAACSGSMKPLSISSSVWSDTSFSGPITKMLESLSIQ
jgi:hypothetical protein